MSEAPSLFEESIEALTFSREATIAEAANIPDERWDFRPHPDANSVSDLVRHIVESTAMLAGEAADPEGDFRRRPPEDHRLAHAGALADEMTPSELREELRRSHDKSVSRIREAGEALMSEAITRFDGGKWSRLTYVFYASSHEAYHCGQLATYARAMGLVPALTQKIRARSAG